MHIQPTPLQSNLLPVARPRVVRRLSNHSCADRIQFNVPATRQQISVRLHDTGFEAAFPQGAGAAFKAIPIACHPPGKRLHQLAQACKRFTRCQQEMDVIGHEAIRVDLDVKGIPQFAEVQHIALVIFPINKDHLPVVASLDDVVRVIGQ